MTRDDAEVALGLPELSPELLATLAAGSHSDPHSVLGQHLVDAAGVGDPVDGHPRAAPARRERHAVLPTGARIELAHVGARPLAGRHASPASSDYTLETALRRRHRLDRRRPVPLRCPRSASSTSTSSARAATSSSGTCSARTTATTRASRASTRAPRSPSGRRTPAPCASSATSTAGTARAHAHAPPRRQRRLGAVRPRPRTRAAPTSSSCSPSAASGCRRADPMARYTEVPPATASVIGESRYTLERRRVDDAARRAATRTTPR